MKKTFKFKVGDCVLYNSNYTHLPDHQKRKWIILNRTSKRYDPITKKHYGSINYTIGCCTESRNEVEHNLTLVSSKLALK